VEAMGCGTPVVSTDCPYGPSDILGHGKYGILVPPRDPEALAAALGRLLDERGQFPAAGLRKRAGGFSYQACADNYARLLHTLAAA
jgi:glycosyltransferase involved in cell wall biosynthesis